MIIRDGTAKRRRIDHFLSHALTEQTGEETFLRELYSDRDARHPSGAREAGRGWIGIVPRGAYVTGDVRVTALLPAWLWLILAALTAVAARTVEGRRGRQSR